MYAVNLSLCKAKNVGDAEHRRGFLTLQKGKRTSRKCEFIIELFHSGYVIMKVPTAVYEKLNVERIWKRCLSPPQISLNEKKYDAND